MKLDFRQGVVRYQSDATGNPTFLQRSTGTGQFVDLIVSPTPCVLAFAHGDANYIIEELKTIQQAWGPITTPATRYLYWDVNLLTGILTRGMTMLPPIYGASAPVTPQLDQCWFDTNVNIFRVYTAQGWAERIRLFAGTVTSAAIIKPSKIGSQAGLTGDCDGGNIVLDSFHKPLRESNGRFVTSVSNLSATNLGTVTSRLESTVVTVMANEEIPKNSLVQFHDGLKVVLARSTDLSTRIAGLIVEDLYEGDLAKLFTSGLVRSSDWAWPSDKINRPLFCGPTGQVTLSPPQQGVLQQIGFVQDAQSIFLNIKQVLVLDNPEDLIPPPPPPPLTLPIANFVATPTSGYAPLTVTFTSTAADAVSTEWDVMNDGYIDGTDTTFTYTYATPGTYTVRQRAINSFGYDEEIKVGYVVVTSPTGGATFTNLGIRFGVPVQVTGGQVFSFQVIVSNDGFANATNVVRTLKLRANNGSQVTVTLAPSGSTTSYANNRSTVTLPLVNILSSATSVITMQAIADANVTSIQLEGTVSSPETDGVPGDNSATVTIGVRP
jgi:PKD repeat protein